MSKFISAKYVKTRKPHQCFGCAREFPKGSILNREAYKEGGTVFTAYMCHDCKKYLQESFPFDYEFYFGDLREAVLEMVGEGE